MYHSHAHTYRAKRGKVQDTNTLFATNKPRAPSHPGHPRLYNDFPARRFKLVHFTREYEQLLFESSLIIQIFLFSELVKLGALLSFRGRGGGSRQTLQKGCCGF